MLNFALLCLGAEPFLGLSKVEKGGGSVFLFSSASFLFFLLFAFDVLSPSQRQTETDRDRQRRRQNSESTLHSQPVSCSLSIYVTYDDGR